MTNDENWLALEQAQKEIAIEMRELEFEHTGRTDGFAEQVNEEVGA